MSWSGMNLRPLIRLVTAGFVVCVLAFGYLVLHSMLPSYFGPSQQTHQLVDDSIALVEDDFDKVVDGIHVQTGLVYAEGFDIVRGTCTACHSAKLVTQSRATREGWIEMIRWMQATQELWDLGDQEPIIVDYLSKHYAPEKIGRRANLDVNAVEWYVLDLEEGTVDLQ